MKLHVRLKKKFADLSFQDSRVQIVLQTILGTSASSLVSFLNIKTHGIEFKFPTSLVTKLIGTKLYTQTEADKLAVFILWEFLKLFKSTIWCKRCNMMNEITRT